MNPQNPLKVGTQPTSQNPLAVMQEGEREIFHIKRHPIGLIAIYGACGLLLAAIAVVLLVGVPAIMPDQKNNAHAIGIIGVLLTAVFMVIVAYVANKVYWGNAWVLTSDSITQIKQTSLFDRQQSQLSLANLEDVTAEQNGILTHMFNYGVLKCETAGEHSKFQFTFCPDPTLYAKEILQAREEFEQGIRHEISGANVNAA